jgi:predicted DNA-binding WGR domain protein
MSFLRKLLGGGKQAKQPERPSGRRSPSPSPSGARPPSPAPPSRPVPRTPTLADLSPRALHAYFEYVGGGSSKFYAVSLEEEEGGTWRVRFNFGRIGFPRAWQTRVEGVPWATAARAYTALVDERTGKGYEIRAWPAALTLPDGTTLDDEQAEAGKERDEVLFRAARRGTLPPPTGGSVGGVPIPDGTLYAPIPEGGSRGDAPVIWASDAPVPNVGPVWARLAAQFPETGIWPFVIDADYGFHGFDDYLMDLPRGRHAEVATILRKGWSDLVSFDDEGPDEELAPFGRQFPGLADPTPGDRPGSIDHIVAGASGHLGLVAVHRPADILDTVGWMGAANYDGDPLDMTTVLRSWEQRFDAYVIGLGPDTLNLAVGRPPRDLDSATAIAAEHYAFCPDNIQQGVGSIREYAEALVDQEQWPFWWD